VDKESNAWATHLLTDLTLNIAGRRRTRFLQIPFRLQLMDMSRFEVSYRWVAHGSPVSVSSWEGVISHCFSVSFRQSLYRLYCPPPPRRRQPLRNCPSNDYFTMRVSSIRMTCPHHSSFAVCRKPQFHWYNKFWVLQYSVYVLATWCKQFFGDSAHETAQVFWCGDNTRSTLCNHTRETSVRQRFWLQW